MTTRGCRWRPLLAGLVLMAAVLGRAGAGEVESFSPQGSVKAVRQVTARFSLPMIALGDPRQGDPFDVQCAAPGGGHWADPRSWVFDFDQDLPGGLRCSFTLRKGLKALDGSAVTAPAAYTFDTGGPAILRASPADGAADIDENQVFLLKLDAPATQQSVLSHARCAVTGIAEEIPVQVLTGNDRAAILKQRRTLGYAYFRLLWKSGAVSDVRVRDREMERAEAALTVLRCQRSLPPGSEVRLLWGEGIQSESGLATAHAQPLTFKVRTAFTAQAECTRVNARAGCLPMLPVSLRFTAPVPRELALAVRLKLHNGTLLAPRIPDGDGGDTLSTLEFAGPFPEKQDVSIVLPARLADDAGRPLQNLARFPLAVRIDELPPLAKFSGAFGILEASEGGVLPVTLRNLEPAIAARQAAMPARLLRTDQDPATILRWLRQVEKAGESRGEFEKIPEAERASPDAPRPKLATEEEEEGEAADADQRWREDTGSTSVFAAADATTAFTVQKPSGAKSFEVVGIPLKETGFYVVELESRVLGRALLGREQSRFVATAALVTDLAVHLKWGRESSLVWVTRLHDGTTVAGADITIANGCTGAILWRGVTDKDGIASVAQSFGAPQGGSYCGERSSYPLFAGAAKDADYSFTLSSWDRGIEPGNFHLPYGSAQDSRILHTVLDRPLYRAGETVSMKHYLRLHTLGGFTVASAAPRRRAVTLEHEGSGQKYSLQAEFGVDGIAENEWRIPAEAKLGTYRITIQDARSAVTSGSFRVEAFRLPTMRGSVSSPTPVLVRPKNLALDLQVAYLAGGGAGGLPVKLRTQVMPRPLHFAGYEDYSFGGRPVVEGLVRDDAGPSLEDGDDDGEEPAPAGPAGKTQVMPLTLDAAGAARVSVPDLPAVDDAAVLTAELEYADANGELLTSQGRVTLVPSALAVGIRSEGWAGTREQVGFRVVVLDLKGEPQANRNVNVALFQAQRYSFRKRLLGGFYAYESSTDTHRLAASCQGRTDAQGLLTCRVAPGVGGEIQIRAETTDADGNASGATASVWVYDDTPTWFGGTSGDRMDLLPEKAAYEAGETARLQVRMPFRGATALVTVERQGVISGFVTHLDGRQPVLELPMQGAYAPNVFVSVLALRGRVAHAEVPSGKALKGEEISSLVDLNKPAYRLGMAVLNVGWKPHRLDVSVSAEHPSYRVREHAKVAIHVERADGQALPIGGEVAVAAVDSALLELAPNRSWDLLAAMMGRRGLEVLTSTAQMQVVGKRHYGRKAVPAGGGGGRERSRELFDTLLLWKGRVKLDGEGNARVEIPLNDSLSEFRIVAIASAGQGFFGTGQATLHTTQELMLLSGLPPLVREGDQYLATVTLRNTSTQSLSAEIAGSQSGLATQALARQQVTLAPGESRNVAWRVTAPAGAEAVHWDISAQGGPGGASDHLRVTQQVIAAVPVRTYQATLAQLAPEASLPVARPAGALPGRGALQVSLQAHLADGLDGVREYLRGYPYSCIEQLLSQAVGLRDRAAWDRALARLPAYQDADGLLRYFPSDAIPGEDSLTAYALQIADAAGWPLPEAAQGRMLQGLKRFVQGKLQRSSAVPSADLTLRKLAAIEALARYGEADPTMLEPLTLDIAAWPTSGVLDYLGILERVKEIPEAGAKQAQALALLRARLTFQGTVLGFSTEHGDALWWLMLSADANANRLLLAVMDRPQWRAEIPQLVRGVLARQQSGHWNTTVANAWGVLAMERFSAAFESTAVSGTTRLHYGATTQSVTWPAPKAGASVALPWQDAPGTLQVAHEGSGKPWVLVRATAALPLGQPLGSGYRITRTVTALEQKSPGHYSRGDVLRVHLDIDAQSDMSWVVVDDAVPGGASLLGTGAGGQAPLLARDARRTGVAWLAFEERRFDALRSYYRFVPKGRFSLEYTLRLNNPGTFQLPPTHVVAMYAPEMTGESPNAAVTVEP